MKALWLTPICALLFACSFDVDWPADRYRPCDANGECLANCSCLGGICVPPSGSYDPAVCGCRQDADCDDGDPCTADSCAVEAGQCASHAITGCCEEDADCVNPDPCVQGTCDTAVHECVWQTLDPCCISDADCDDGDECTADTCVDGSCLHEYTCPACDSWSEICFNGEDEDCDEVADQCCLGTGNLLLSINPVSSDAETLNGLIVADFDGDRILDVFSAETGPDGNALLLGQGAQGVGYGSYLRQPGGGCAPVRHLLAADFDGDLRPDPVLLCQDENADASNLQVLWTKEGSPFSARELESLASEALSMAAGDFDRDGAPDLFVTFLSASPQVLRRGLNTDNLPRMVSVDSCQQNDDPFECHGPVAAGDFDSDSWTDVACADESGIHLLLNRGWGCESMGQGIEFEHHHVLTQDQIRPNRLLATDLDGDGTLDLVSQFTNDSGSGLSIYRAFPSQALPVFDEVYEAVTAATQATHLAAGDMDNDGHLDILIPGEQGVHLFFWDGNWSFRQELALASGSAYGLAAGDVDRDGIADLLVQVMTADLPSPAQIKYLRGLGSGGHPDGSFLEVPPPAFEFAESVNCVHSADLNRDGLDDLVAGGASGLSIFLADGHRGRPTGSYHLAATGNLAEAIDWISSGDMDGDGWPEIVAGSANLDTCLIIQTMDGTIFTSTQRLLFGGMANTRGALADVDRDGKAELFVIHQPKAEGDVVGYTIADDYHDMAFQELDNRQGLDILAFSLSDVNQDGWPDLAALVHDSGNRSVQVLFNAAAEDLGFEPRFAPGLHYPVEAGALLVESGDLNGDGWLDVVLASQSQIWVLANQQGESLSSPGAGRTVGRIAHLLLQDVTGDGLDDVLVIDTSSDQAQLLVMRAQISTIDGGIELEIPEAFPLGLSRTGGICAGRFNHDGFVDLATGDAGAETGVHLLLGQGSCQ